jgi:erythritol transport system ATP-binding protein
MNVAEREVIFEARGVLKRYPGTVALKSINYRVYRNRVNVLIGENGAGKSTLMKILAGVERPDEGELLLEGKAIEIRSPREAAAHGIAIVHQELSILPNLDVAENVFAGREPVRYGIIVDQAAQERRSSEALRRLRTTFNVHTKAGHLSLGSRQLVEVARTLDQGARVLILDEPTSALSNAEAEDLFQVMAELKSAGVTIIYISHRLNELLHLGDDFTVLRSGKIVGEAPREAVSREWIVQRMSGKDISAEAVRSQTVADQSAVLGVQGISLPPSRGDGKFQAPLCGVSFELRKGEILGIYGLLGAGRTELIECLAGMRPISSGKILVDSKDAPLATVRDATSRGIRLVPEDRHNDGLFPELSVRENITFGMRKKALINRKDEDARSRLIARELNIAVGDFELPVAALSGGNQQKVLIARCLLCCPKVLLLDEPTRGVDVGAKAEIYQILRNLADRGLSILFTSSEIEETQALGDRALVLCQGRISATLSKSELTDEGLFEAASPHVRTSAAVPGPGEILA